MIKDVIMRWGQDWDAHPGCLEVGFREVGNCVGAGRQLRASHGRLVSYVAGSTPGHGAADKRSRRTFLAENRSSTALVGCSWTIGSALAAAATVGAVAQYWLSWMLERSARFAARKPDWISDAARGPRRSECPPRSSRRCAG